MTAHDRVKFLGQGKDHVEIGNCQQLTAPLLEPEVRIVPLTLRAMAILARVIRILAMSAAVTVIDMAAQHFRTTITDVVERTTVPGQHLLAEPLQIRITIAAKYVRDFQHHRVRHL